MQFTGSVVHVTLHVFWLLMHFHELKRVSFYIFNSSLDGFPIGFVHTDIKKLVTFSLML